MNYSLIGADRYTHLKIVAVALVCSVLVGLAFHSSLLAAATPNPHLIDVQFAANTENKSVCRINAL